MRPCTPCEEWLAADYAFLQTLQAHVPAAFSADIKVSKTHAQLLEETEAHHMLENLPDVAAGGQLWLCVRKALAPVWDRRLILPP